MPYLEAVPKEGLRPKVHEIEYALPGDKLDKHAMWVGDVESGKAVRVSTDPIENIYWDSPTPTWNADNTGFWYRQLDRNYRRKRVYFVNALNGEAKTVLDERTNTFFSPLKDFWQVVDKSLLYLSDLDGWNHLYRYDAETGTLLNRITQGNWEVRTAEILPNTDEILFSAGGREAGDPYLLHHYRIKFDGSGLTELTPEAGDNSFQRSPNGKYYLVTRSLVNQPPVHTLRRWSDGKEVMELERGEIAALEKTGWRRVEPFVAKGRDGTTDIYGVLYRPSHFNPAKKYPVVEFIYSGPHDAYVPKRFTPWDRNQKLAELGFIVVQVDGMGTAWRGRAFHEVCYRNLADSGFPDHIAWMRAAAEKYPQMDLSRVGIYGYSAGGYNALRALIAHSDFYKASVALCGNHDHRTDKTWWNELWMGDDVGKHYLEQSNVTNADKLQGKLLLVHGTEDENVYSFASTLRVADALIKANKDFEMFLVPGRGHNLAGDYVDRKIYDHFVRNLAGKEPRRPH
jgi:dipeptidyl aminopeptidase/acylaminoacyl peptidase